MRVTEVAVTWLGRQVETSRAAGFPGLRVAVDMGRALRPVTGIEELPRFEEGITGVLDGSTASVLCQYDRSRFDPVTLASVSGFHTRSVAAATYYADAVLRICRQYAPPGIRIAGEIDYQAAEPLALALAEAVRLDGDVTMEQDFDAGSLYALRSAVAAHAAADGLPPARVYDVVAAAHELAANAVRHGAGQGNLRLRAADGVLTCQVSDDGPAGNGENRNPDAGTAPWPAEHGHGLWVSEQVADQLTIDRGPAGTTITASFALRPPP